MADVKRWATSAGVLVRYFKKGEKKESVAEPLLEAAANERGQGRAVLLGIAHRKGLGVALLSQRF